MRGAVRRSKRALAVGVAVLAMTALSGCQLLTANAPVRTPTAIEACATGHVWELDTAVLAESAKVSMNERGLAVTVAVAGSQTLTWDEDFSMAFETDLTFTGTLDAGPAGFVETYTANGTSTGRAFFSGDMAIPRDWTEDLEITETATQDGAPADLVFRWIPLWINDTVGLKATCSGDQLQLAARQGHLIWTFNRVS